MTTLRQIEANRLNSLKSTGPRTEDGKQRSRLNAVRHGLTAETVIACLEDAEDYKAFEEAICEGYAPFTAVERELVLRVANLLWRLRRANLIETELFASEAIEQESQKRTAALATADSAALGKVFLRLVSQPNKPLDRLTRYEAALWRQAKQLLAQLNGPPARRSSRFARQL